MSKIRIYINQLSSNPTSAIIGIPDDIQLNSNISSIQLSQVEILPPPSSVNDLFIQPLVINNSPCTANANISATILEPGFKLNAVPFSDGTGVVQQIQVEEVQIPEGYIHLDDFSEWHAQNYNSQNKITGDNFRPLPNLDSSKPQFDVYIKDKKFTCAHNNSISEIKIYYKRENQSSWVDWVDINRSEEAVFPHAGAYNFRFVPFFEGKQIGSIDHKEEFRKWEEPTRLRWSDIQIDLGMYKILMAGEVGTDVNYVEVYQKLQQGEVNYKKITSLNLKVDENGKINETFIAENISSSDLYPCLEYRFYRKNSSSRNTGTGSLIYVRKEIQSLSKNYNNIDGIDINVEKIDKTISRIQIDDQHQRLFRPPQAQRWRQASDWEKVAIPNQKIMLRLLIYRYQNGQRRNYGSYLINYTQDEPKFLDGLPFRIVNYSDTSIVFDFQDNEEFRSLQNIDSPNTSSENLTYEFRLLGWTAGVEESLITNIPKIIPRSEQVLFNGELRDRLYAYNTWSLEHPQVLNTRTMPVSPAEDKKDSHLRYGSFYKGFVIEKEALPFLKTTNLNITSVGWKVLYYSNEDEIQEFPYYCFNVEIPYSTRQAIDTIDVCISLQGTPEPLKIGTYHPSQTFQVVDFTGYFEAREYITQQSNLSAVISDAPNYESTLLVASEIVGNASPLASELINNGFDTPAATTGMPVVGTATIDSSHLNLNIPSAISTMTVNTPADNLEAINSMRAVNNSIAQIVESGTVDYILKVKYTNGNVDTWSHSADISTRPRLPPDPPGNTSVVIGNQTISAAVYAISQESSQQLIQVLNSSNLQNAVTPNFVANSVSFGDY